MSDGEQRWKCPKCSRSFRIPAGKSAPEACPDCLRATAAKEVDQLAKFAADEEAARVAVETFVKVEKPEPEVFKEAEQPAEKLESVTGKEKSTIWRQDAGWLSYLSLAIVVAILAFTSLLNSSSSYYSKRDWSFADAIVWIGGVIATYASFIICVMAMQSIQFSRISRELWQLRYELEKRDHDSKNPQN